MITYLGTASVLLEYGGLRIDSPAGGATTILAHLPLPVSTASCSPTAAAVSATC